MDNKGHMVKTKRVKVPARPTLRSLSDSIIVAFGFKHGRELHLFSDDGSKD
jgi:hypothetical protein